MISSTFPPTITVSRKNLTYSNNLLDEKTQNVARDRFLCLVVLITTTIVLAAAFTLVHKLSDQT